MSAPNETLLICCHAAQPVTNARPLHRDGDREIVYKEIKHLTMLKDVKQVVEILEVIEHGNDMYIAMEARRPINRGRSVLQPCIFPHLARTLL